MSARERVETVVIRACPNYSRVLWVPMPYPNHLMRVEGRDLPTTDAEEDVTDAHP